MNPIQMLFSLFETLFNSFLAGWRSKITTALGLIVLIAAASAQVSLLFDADPLTSPDFETLKSLYLEFTVGIGLIFSRDAIVSTEESKKSQAVKE